MNRLPDRIDGALALAAAGAVVLFVSLFLSWYSPDLSAIDAFEIVDLVLAVAAIASLVIAIRAATVEPGYEDPETDWLMAIGLAAVAIVIFVIVDNPPAVAGRAIEAGAWLALVGGLAIAGGSLLWRSRLSLVLTLRPRERAAEPAVGPPPPAAADPVDDDEDVIAPAPYEPADEDETGSHETIVEPRSGAGPDERAGGR